MANSEIKHIDLASIGTSSGASGVSVPGMRKKTMKKKVVKTSKKVQAHKKSQVSRDEQVGSKYKTRKTKRSDVVDKPKAPPIKKPPVKKKP